MAPKQISFLVYLCLLLLYVQAHSQTLDKLPRSTPEAEGVSSEQIQTFLEAAGKSKHEFHSFMLLRHGKVVSEGWWKPYAPELKHTMYSVSKTFTSTAIGLAVSEKRLSVNDKVISFFPDDVPATISPNLSELTVKHLLSMTAGHDPDPTFATAVKDSNWVKAFLAVPVVHKPGTVFLYNTLATYMLSAIIQKVTGEKLIDYLRPRLFQPLGIQGMDWEVDPMGRNVGGWGLRIKTEDMAKLGQLYLQKGQWNGKQILPEAWIEEATTQKILQSPEMPQTKRDSSDWHQGYCYQIWRSRHNSFRADGAYGQFILMLPEQDAVVVLTAETSDMQSELNLVWEHLLPAFDAKTTVEKSKTAALSQKLTALALPVPAKSTIPAVAKRITARAFTFPVNDKNIETMAFQFVGSTCQLTVQSGKQAYKLSFGNGSWQPGTTERHGPYLLAKAKAKFVGLPPFKIAGAYEWKDENTLELTLRYIESPHTETFTCRFNQNTITVAIKTSIEPEDKKTVLNGTLQTTQKVPVKQ